MIQTCWDRSINRLWKKQLFGAFHRWPGSVVTGEGVMTWCSGWGEVKHFVRHRLKWDYLLRFYYTWWCPKITADTRFGQSQFDILTIFWHLDTCRNNRWMDSLMKKNVHNRPQEQKFTIKFHKKSTKQSIRTPKVLLAVKHPTIKLKIWQCANSWSFDLLQSLMKHSNELFPVPVLS